jgi:hypothetical protein
VEVAAEDNDDDDDTWKAKKTEERTVEVTGRTDAACQKKKSTDSSCSCKYLLLYSVCLEQLTGTRGPVAYLDDSDLTKQEGQQSAIR